MDVKFGLREAPASKNKDGRKDGTQRYLRINIQQDRTYREKRKKNADTETCFFRCNGRKIYGKGVRELVIQMLSHANLG